MRPQISSFKISAPFSMSRFLNLATASFICSSDKRESKWKRFRIDSYYFYWILIKNYALHLEMRCKITILLWDNQIFFILLQLMGKYITYIGFFSIVVGIVFFTIHILFHIKGNITAFWRINIGYWRYNCLCEISKEFIMSYTYII